MAIVCYICKKEVHLVSFGSGYVGTCCNRVLFNAAIKPQFDKEKEEQKNFSMHVSRQEKRYCQAKHS